MGRGEAAPSARYNEFIEGITKILEEGISLPDTMNDPVEFSNVVLPQSKGIKSLEVALSMAILDWWCQKEGITLYQYFGANPDKTPKTSFTISIGDMDLIPEKVAEASPYHILKIKLGMGEKEDKAIMNAIRAETDTLIRVDANEGWDLETGIKMCRWLSERNVEFVEQPFRSTNLKDTAAFRKESPLPLVPADNSLNSSDIPGLHVILACINIKLMP